MIIFKKVTMKNFMSVGNSPLTVNLNENRITLVYGENGTGKSSLFIESLVFVLYGKPFRDLKKEQLVNSFNGKQCLVEVEFTINGVSYVVKRGIKPAIFEIYKDSVLVDRSAKVLDYQDYLEKNILKMNLRTFTQLVIMGSKLYKPFMKLPAAERREFTEDSLDIKFIGVMNRILKVQINKLTASINELQQRLSLAESNIKAQQRLIEQLISGKESLIEAKRASLSIYVQDVEKLKDEVNSLVERNKELQIKLGVFSEIKQKLDSLKELQLKLNHNVAKAAQSITFLDENNTCPTCKQTIQTDHKEEMVAKTKDKKRNTEAALLQIQNKIESLLTMYEELISFQNEINSNNSSISTKNSSISVSNRNITSILSDIESLSNKTESQDEEEAMMASMKTEKEEIESSYKAMKIELQYSMVMLDMLKDSGVKSLIIEKYLPILNKLINHYLNELDLFISFHLDNEFNESVKSRHRDSYTYSSFSEGQKQRIDLAILFAFRDIAQMRNAGRTNILVMDEILDQSLDLNGVDGLLKLVNNLKNMNVFIISHREGVQEKFDHSICLKLQPPGFTIISDTGS